MLSAMTVGNPLISVAEAEIGRWMTMRERTEGATVICFFYNKGDEDLYIVI